MQTIAKDIQDPLAPNVLAAAVVEGVQVPATAQELEPIRIHRAVGASVGEAEAPPLPPAHVR